MSTPSYGFTKQIENLAFDTAVTRVKEALKKEGFGVLTTIDVKSAMKEKLDLDFRPYVILGACNPLLAHKALEAEEYIGLLLPCNVVVQQSGDHGVNISIADPKIMFTLVDNAQLKDVAEEAEKRLRRVIENIA